MTTHYSRRRFLTSTLGAVVVGSTVSTGCARANTEPAIQSSQPVAPAQYVFANAATAPTLDPSLTDNLETHRIARQILDGLVAPDPMTGDPVPALATAWRASEDGLSWDFALREGVVFHDGSALDAEAVVENFNRWAAASVRDAGTGRHSLFDAVFRRGAPNGSTYQRCEAVDQNTVRILLTRPYPALPKVLTHPAFGMAAPSSIANDSVGTAPVGTGPFTVGQGLDSGSGQRPGESVILNASETYWGDLGPVGVLEFVAIPDTELRYVALRNEQVDGYDLVGLSAFAPLAREGVQVLQRDPYSVAYLGLYSASGAFADINVRHALMSAVDRQAIVRDHYPEGTSVAQAFLPARFNVPNTDVGFPGYNPAEARDLLGSSQYDGAPLRFLYPTGASRSWALEPERLYADLSAMLTRAGFEIVPVPVPWSVYDETLRTRSRDHDLFLSGITGGFRDPDYFTATLFSALTPELGSDSKVLRDLVDQASQSADGEQRQDLYRQVNTRVIQEKVALPLAFATTGVAVDARTAAFPLSSTGFEEFNSLTLNEAP
ncbi:ABC transporter substrate-binding protein [Kocuria sp.]|uniref:ABC transporter substrate-binding protein n=1 Tax=Kocuria sp. TaxID=1871328 RepID=UPI0026DEF05D|nr:ABC transporter substrate-binding protein [Kocuria sp.]MDO5618348.1 ABC transporter substrate-binding protein [Kocuria sp.]